MTVFTYAVTMSITLHSPSFPAPAIRWTKLFPGIHPSHTTTRSHIHPNSGLPGSLPGCWLSLGHLDGVVHFHAASQPRPMGFLLTLVITHPPTLLDPKCPASTTPCLSSTTAATCRHRHCFSSSQGRHCCTRNHNWTDPPADHDWIRRLPCAALDPSLS